MTTQPIRIFGDPVLRTPAKPVVDFDQDLKRLVEDLMLTMRAAPGAGLAANQIGVSLQVFVYDAEGQVGHMINPRLELSDQQQLGSEGCLSVPGLSHPTTRALEATVHGVDQHGDPLTVTGTGFLARAFQHEVGHLHGQLYLDHLRGDDKKQAMKELRESAWFNTQPALTQIEPAAFRDWY